MIVIKRDGRKVLFNILKIQRSIETAIESVDGTVKEKEKQMAIKISEIVRDKLVKMNKDEYDIQVVQDIIEQELMKSSRKDVAKKYLLYRDERARNREFGTQMMKEIVKKMNASDVQNQNANIDERSFTGRIGEADAVLQRKLALDNLMSLMSKENHLNNRIYIHDLNAYYSGQHNCLSIPFDDLLAKGFKSKQCDVRPAGSINTAFQLVAVIFQMESLCQFGGVSATHLDWTMVPYVRRSFRKHYLDILEYQYPDLDIESIKNSISKDTPIDDVNVYSEQNMYNYAMKMTKKELQQAVEGFYHNLNTLQARSSGQLPFSSINYGSCTLTEGRMVIEALLDGSLNGVGEHHHTPIFPCGIFQLGKGINREPGDPNYDMYLKALKSTGLRLYPNYANLDWSGNEGYDKNDPRTYFSTMGCRTANGWDVNGFGQLKDGRGNICPVTIILPTIAMESYDKCIEENVDATEDDIVNYFMKYLDQKIHEAKDMLLERFEWICSQDASSARFLYENNLMAGYVPEEGIRSALKHGTIVIGQLGLAECLQILIGCNHTEAKGMLLAKKIEQLFKDRCKQFKEEYKLNFALYYSPSENLCYTAMKKFKDKYGEIPNVSENKFFTNSMHVPVWEKVNAFEKIDIESQLTGYSGAGCITYVEFDAEAKHNPEALKAVIDYAMDKDIPYFAINVPVDTCIDCGYSDVIGSDGCPECHSQNIERLRRVTGYLSTSYENFNLGKQQEVEMRVKHG